MGTSNKAQNSFYKNIFLSDLRKDMNSTYEMIDEYKSQIAQLKSQI